MTSESSPYEHPGSPPVRPELPEGVHRPSVPPPGGPPSDAAGGELPGWPAWAPFAGLLLTLAIAIAGATAIAVLAQLGGAPIADHTPAGVTIGATMLQDAALVFSAVLFAKLTAGRPTAWDFGLRRVRLATAAKWFAIVLLAFYVISNVYGQLVDVGQEDDLPDQLGANDSSLNLVLVLVLVCLIAPVCEELFFRGFCFTALRRRLGWLPGALATGLIFGLIHAGSADWVFLPPLGLLGFLLCVLYMRTGSLLPCMALHALNNAVALSVTQDFSAAGTVALVIGAPGFVVSIGLLAARSRRLNDPAPATA
jgi:membrane protease YdiL (CAAX protease family)